MMHIGLTGGSGFIGRFIIEKLLAYHYLTFIRNLDLEPPRFSGDFEYIKGDVCDLSTVKKFCDDLDIVIHLAAAHRDFGISDEEFYRVNLHGTKSLLESMSLNGVNRLIFYSSVAVYGLKNLPADEDTPPQPENVYGASKLAAEKEIIKWVNELSERQAVIIRPSVVIGPRNTANMFSLIDQIYKRRYLFNFGSGTNIKSMAYVLNLVDFTLELLFNNFFSKIKYEVFNYVDYPQMSIRKTIEIIHQELGLKIPALTLPLNFVLTMARPFDLLISMFNKNLPISTARIKKLTTTTHFETNKIKSQNGFLPKYDLEWGLRDMVRWYTKEYN